MPTEHERRRKRADDDEQQHLPLCAEHRVITGARDGQQTDRRQPRPQRKARQPARRGPLQADPHQRGVERPTDQRADGKRNRTEVERKKEGGEDRRDDTIERKRRQDDGAQSPTVIGRRAQVGMLSSSDTKEPITH